MKQSAVQYIVDTLFTRDEKEIHYDIIQQAKEMEKQQIIESNCDGQSLHAKSVTNSMMQDNAEAYYSEVYGK